jgi:hypothetical protein
MKVRILWAAPGSPLECGKVYNLADADHLIATGDAEKVGKGEPALDDPRPQPEAAADAEPEADAAADDAGDA